MRTDVIPPITDPRGRLWDQPNQEDILVDDKVAVMGKSTLGKLREYSVTIPTGAYAGKMWKSRYVGGWVLRWYSDAQGETLTIHSRPILLLRETS